MHCKAEIARVFGPALVIFLLAANVGHVADAKKKPTNIKATGQVVAVERGLIHVSSSEHGKLSLPIAGGVDVHVRGDFTPTQLRPGMNINFSGIIKSSVVEEEIEQATLFSLADGFKLGIVKISGQEKQSILGRIEKVEGHVVTLNCGRKVTATFSEKAKIRLDSTDYSLASPGDKVDFRGRLEGKGQFKASSVIITPQVVVPKPVKKPAAPK